MDELNILERHKALETMPAVFFEGFERTVTKSVPKIFAALTGGDFFNNNDKKQRFRVLPFVCPPQAENFTI